MAPRVDVVSLYTDQVSGFDSQLPGMNEGFQLDDLGAFMARKYKMRVCGSIREALCLGGPSLAVDGVLLIGEHGDYPLNELGQQMYPRRHFFEQAAAVMAHCGRSVPVFVDKYLASSWDDALWMYERSQQLQIPFMAGTKPRDKYIPVGSSISSYYVTTCGPRLFDWDVRFTVRTLRTLILWSRQLCPDVLLAQRSECGWRRRWVSHPGAPARRGAGGRVCAVVPTRLS